MEETKGTNLLQHFLNVGVGTVINVLLGLITTPLITRIVDPADYGSFSVFNSYVDVILALVFIGLDKSLIRFFYNGDNEDKTGLVKLCFVFPIAASLMVFCVYSLLIYLGIVDSRFAYIYIILMLSYVLVTVWNRISTTLLRLTYKTKEYSWCKIIEKIVYTIIIVGYVLAIRKYYFLMLIMAAIIPCAVVALISTVYTKEYWNFKGVPFSCSSKEAVVYGVPFIIYSAMIALLDSLDKFAIDAYCNDYEVGVYSSGLALVALFLILKSIFETVWAPLQTEHYTKNPEDTSFIQKGSRYISIIMFFLGLNIIMFKDLICFILGAKYRGAGAVLPFLFLGAVAYSISDTTVVGIDYSKKSYMHSIIGGIVIVINFLGNNYLVPIMGITGAAIATSFSYLVYLILRTFFSNRYYYIDFGVKKLFIMFVLLTVFASVSTFIDKLILNIVFYLISMAVFIFIYRQDMKDMFVYVFDYLKAYLKK